MLFLYFWLPLGALAAISFLLLSKRRTRAVKWMALFALLGGAGTSVLYVFLILRQTSSTAAIGIIFVPFLGMIAAGFFALLGLSVYQALHLSELWRSGMRGRAYWFAAVFFVLGSVWYVWSQGARLVTFEHAKNPNADPAFLEQQGLRSLEKRDYFMLSAVASNSRTPPHLLLQLVQTNDSGLYKKRNDVLDIFDRDSLAVVRKALRNPSLPPEAIPFLAKSEDAYVLGDVVMHKDTPEPILREIFARNDSYLVRWGLAGNPHTPPEILEKLAQDGVELGAGVVDTHHYTLMGLADNPSTPPQVLETLARNADPLVRRGVARNPSTPRPIMELLASDSVEEVRFYLSINEALTPDVVETLKQDSSERVRKYAGESWRRHPKKPTPGE